MAVIRGGGSSDVLEKKTTFELHPSPPRRVDSTDQLHDSQRNFFVPSRRFHHETTKSDQTSRTSGGQLFVAKSAFERLERGKLKHGSKGPCRSTFPEWRAPYPWHGQRFEDLPPGAGPSARFVPHQPCALRGPIRGSGDKNHPVSPPATEAESFSLLRQAFAGLVHPSLEWANCCLQMTQATRQPGQLARLASNR